jgi:hypothetical protein
MLSTSAELGAKVLRLGVDTTQMQLDQAVVRAVVASLTCPRSGRTSSGAAFPPRRVPSRVGDVGRALALDGMLSPHLYEDALRTCAGGAKELFTDTLGFDIVRFWVPFMIARPERKGGMFETREKIYRNFGVGAAAECGRAADWFAGARIADVLAEILLAADRAQVGIIREQFYHVISVSSRG